MQSVEVEPNRVRIHDDRASHEISCPLEGVVRVRHAASSVLSSVAHPRLPPKSSWAVIRDDGRALEVEHSAEAVRVRAPGATLELGLTPFGWRFLDSAGELRARCTHVRSDPRFGYPAPAWHAAMRLDAPEGHAYLGLGEKVGPIDKRGLRFTFWNTDVLPHLEDTDPLYASIPFVLVLADGRAHGLFVDETWRAEVDLAKQEKDALWWEVNGPELDVYLISGPEPAEVVRRYTELTGRMPLPPLWSLGAHQSRWGYESAEDVVGVVRAYRDLGLPLDAVHLDIDHQRGFAPLVFDRSRFPDMKALVAKVRGLGAHLVTIVDPAIPAHEDDDIFRGACDRDLLVRSDRGDVLRGSVWPDPCVWPDFTREEVRAFWAQRHQPLLELGVSGVWNDMNEPSAFTVDEVEDLTPPSVARGLPRRREGNTLPYDARHGPRRHIEVHNVYGLGMAMAAHQAFVDHARERRPFVLTRAAYAGIQRYAAVWTGDNSSYWGHLERSVAMLAGLGVSGVPFVGADVPGFLGDASGELLVRWMEAGVFYPLFRNHSARGTPPKEPWRHGEPFLSLARALLERRYRLLPTLYTLFREHEETGLAPLRPLALHWPQEPEALRTNDQFLWGRDLLVAPVVRPKQTHRLVWLPPGNWVALFGLDAEPHLLVGGEHVIAHAPLGHTPIYLRAGGGLALTEARPHTQSANFEHLEWHLHVADAFGARVFEDEGEGHGAFRDTRLRGTRSGGTIRIERETSGDLPSRRVRERLHLHGAMGKVSAVSGAALTGEAGVVLELEPNWDVVELTLQ